MGCALMFSGSVNAWGENWAVFPSCASLIALTSPSVMSSMNSPTLGM
jgi:hypothetical protein